MNNNKPQKLLNLEVIDSKRAIYIESFWDFIRFYSKEYIDYIYTYRKKYRRFLSIDREV